MQVSFKAQSLIESTVLAYIYELIFADTLYIFFSGGETLPLRCNPTSSGNGPKKMKLPKPKEITLAGPAGLRSKESIEASGAYERPKYRPSYSSKDFYVSWWHCFFPPCAYLSMHFYYVWRRLLQSLSVEYDAFSFILVRQKLYEQLYYLFKNEVHTCIVVNLPTMSVVFVKPQVWRGLWNMLH